MNSKAKTDSSTLIGILVFIAAVLIFISIPFASYAQTGTLGQDSPEIYCTYEQDGQIVDGNKLTAGTYDVSFVLSGMSDLSVFEVTATYDTDQVTVEPAPLSLISDDDSALDSMGYILSDGNIVFGFVSTKEDCSTVEGEQIIATVKMTFASDCDAEDYITVSENPNLTFAQADYGDGYDDEYALVESYPDYVGELHPMTCDVTPGFGHSVKGNIVVMTNSNGETNGVAVYGEYKIDVYADAAKSDLVTSVFSARSTNENNQIVNEFIIDSLTDGTYYATISSQYAISRDIIIRVNGDDIVAQPIAIVACDFNTDGDITAMDAGTVYVQAASGQAPYCDLNGDGDITAMDAGIVYTCAAGTLNYEELIIE